MPTSAPSLTLALALTLALTLALARALTLGPTLALTCGDADERAEQRVARVAHVVHSGAA